MKFKKIEIYGFKSFADKLDVSFGSGVTGIVGPNGCGKSNVADAIRWVMGEQSAKALRGANMQDVIFNGTDSRKKQSFCEVSLFFDNSERIFPLEYDEVVFTRKLYRSGESEYQINKNTCRMKDIVDALRDSGLGKESYSIIGQGKIDSLLSAKPEERRSVFEEAAGISRFKSRKLEAERKLDHTNDNLTRLNDIILELERQLGPLAEQSEKAQKFLALRDTLRDLELNIYVAQFDSASTNKEAIYQKLAGLNEELETKQIELEKVIHDYEFSRESITNLDYQIEKLRDEQLEITVNLEKQSGQSNLVRERLNNASQSAEKLQVAINQDDALLGVLTTKIEERKAEKSKLESTVTDLERQLEKINSEYLEIVDRITAGEKTAELSGDEIYSALDKLGDVKSSISSLNTEKSNLKTRVEEINARQKEIRKLKIETENKLADKELELEKTQASLQNKKSQQVEITEEVRALSQKLNDLYTLQQETNAEFHTKVSRARIMQEMAEENEGYILSVKRLLEQAKTNSTLGGMMVGVVAKLMKVPQNLEVALEMALGSAVQNIVTHNEDEAKYIVNLLKQNKFGRATFLPISSVKERSIPADLRPKLKAQGVLGVASDLISYAPAHAPVFKSLLGSTVIVDNIDNAVALAKNTRYGFKIVTLDGDVINPQGSITGGSKKEVAVNLLSRERELADTKKAVEVLKTELDQIAQKIERAKANKDAKNATLLELSGAIHDLEVAIVKIDDEIENLNNTTDDFDVEDRNLNYQLESIQDKLEIIDVALNESTNKEQEINDKKTVASESKRIMATRFDQLKKQRETLYETLTDLKVKKASAEAELAKAIDDIDRFETEEATSNERVHENTLELQKNRAIIADYQKLLDSFEVSPEQTEAQERLNEIKDELSKMDANKGQLQAKMNNADSAKMQLSTEIQRASDKKTKEEMALQKIDTDIETMQERVWEEYSMTYADAIAYKKPEFDLTKGLAESGKIKKEINALGYVNVSAIEDVKVVGERYNDLSSQRDDLTKTREDLLKIIKELTTQMEARFTEQFQKINENFKTTFKELFGGGRAELILHNDVSCLEAGIDIIAEPPGKKLQSITLLSGGERAFTAVAILFAILKLRPMPFCVLDEIEAALDDANVERFAKYLKRFSQDTQFIVITHRKPTMELADCLYGVTMEEKGVSKMVSVKLSDATKLSTEEAS